MSLTIAHVVFPVPVDSHFDYLIPEHLIGSILVGSRVQAVFARKKSLGIVVGLAARSDFPELITIIKRLDITPLFSVGMLDFARSFARENGCSLGEALFLFLPPRLRKPVLLKTEACLRVTPSIPSVSLLFDRSLTGRWNILTAQIRDELSVGRGVLVLVPESSYLEDVLARLAELAPAKERVLLRQGTEKQEYERWQKVYQGEARLVVGFLSAVFAPVQPLGLIIVIDEESHFYKSDQTPFYHAREAALLRAGCQGARVICVSSAPSVELWREVADGRVVLEKINADLPPVRFLDISNFKMKKGSLLSPGLRLHLEGVLKNKGKAILYVPAAKGVAFVLEELKKYMPQARAAGYERVSSVLPEADVIVATQAIFRYRGKLRVDFAAVLDIDYEFHKSDHRAAHLAFALVQYLRQMAQKMVLLQTRESQSLQLHAIADEGHEKFYLAELASREEMQFPPFGVFVALVVRSADPELACAEAKRLYDILSTASEDGVNVMEPQQDRAAILRGKFRWCVTLQGQDRRCVINAGREAVSRFRGKKDIVLTMNIDP